MGSPLENGSSFHPIGRASSRAAFLMDLKVHQSLDPIGSALVNPLAEGCGDQRSREETATAGDGLHILMVSFHRWECAWNKFQTARFASKET